jgi:hypothetical protein
MLEMMTSPSILFTTGVTGKYVARNGVGGIDPLGMNPPDNVTLMLPLGQAEVSSSGCRGVSHRFE